jgi:hypothetical protein
MKRETRAEIALSVPEYRQIDGEHDRRVPGLPGLVEHLLRQLPVRVPVELEPARPLGSCLGDVGGARRREGREAHHRAGRCGTASGCELALRMSHPLVGDRGGDDRH